MRTPPTTVISSVAVTITLAAIRTDGGSRRKRDIRRSMGFGRGMLGTAGSITRDVGC